MKLGKLIQSLETLETAHTDGVEVKSIDFDSRTVRPGSLFVAIRGQTADGIQYVAEAVTRGAVAVVSENRLELGAHVAAIRVADARRALAELACAFHGHPSRGLKVAGITGTNGKTTIAYLLRDILRDTGLHPGLVGTVAYEFGDHALPARRTTPEAPVLQKLFRQMADAGCDSVAIEVSSHAIDLQRIHGTDFDVGVFTNLTQDHLDYHGSMDRYFDAKARFFQALEEGRVAVVNADDPWGRRLLEANAERLECLPYGLSDNAAVRARDIRLDADGSRFLISTPWGEGRVHLQLLGRFNIQNALAAVAVGGSLGIPPDRVFRTLESVRSIPGRLERVGKSRRKRVFVDYAHTDDALRNVLSTLREICKGRLVVVFGCGGDRDRGKRLLMGRVAAELADYAIITSDNPRSEDPGAIAGEIIKGFGTSGHFEVELDRRAAIEKGIDKIGRRDILLVAGKGHETYQESQGTIVPFDDRETVREILG